ncbi:hypothetical protein ACQY0O_006614 [Thecaphora frezii]
MGGQPPTAAIVVASIFGGIAVLFFGYRLYKKLWNFWHRESLLPPVREPPSAYYGQTPITPMMQGSPYSVFGGAHATGSKGSSIAVPSPAYNGVVTPSEIPSPSTAAADSLLDAGLLDGSDSHGRGYSTVSSSSSTMTLKRSYAKPSSASALLALSTPTNGRRESYLPHSPLNRDSIQIVPPQPLGFGTGGFAMATDQRTLAFSKSSGIGAGDDLTSGLVWAGSEQQQQNGSRRSSRAYMGEEERRKYLMEGPSSTLRSSSPAVASSATSHASGRTAPTAGPSFPPMALSARVRPAMSEASSNLDPQTVRRDARMMTSIDARAFDETKSPLQRVVTDRHAAPHHRMPSEATSLETDVGNSPILGAFQTPSSVGSRSSTRPSPQPSTHRSRRASPPNSSAAGAPPAPPKA